MLLTSSKTFGTDAVLTVDVIIGGGGGMGSAVAYFLKAWGPSTLRVLVIEQDPTYVRAATTLAAGGIRQQFSTPENILMSQFGYEFLRHAADELSLNDSDPPPNVGLRVVPFLHLAGGTARVAELRESWALQQRLGSTSTWLSRAALSEKYPWLITADVKGAVLGGHEEGVFDPYALLQALRRKAISLGAEYRHAKLVAVRKDRRGTITGVQLDNGLEIRCGAFVNAGGPKAATMAALAGIVLPVVPVRAHTFVFRAEKPPAREQFPIIVDGVLGLNVRAEGDQFIAATPREGDMSDAGDNFDVDYTLFDSLVWPLLASRIAAFEAIRMTGAWVGHIEWNTLDSNPIIGNHPTSTNMYFINGFSGHGAQHCPAAGRALAELILYGKYRSLDLTRFSYNRVLKANPLRERY